jgi:hypothetical protein
MATEIMREATKMALNRLSLQTTIDTTIEAIYGFHN